MLHHFLRNAILLIGLNLLVKGVYLLVVERAVQNALPVGDYGLYFSLFNFTLLLQLVLDFGLQLYNSRNLAGNRAILAKYFPHYLGLKLVLALAFLSSILMIGFGIGYRGPALLLLLIVGGNQIMMSLLLFLRSNLTGMGRYRADSWVSVADKALMLVLVGGLLLVAREQMNIYTFVLAQSMSWAISLVVVASLLRSRLETFWPKFKPAVALSLLKRSAPFALVIFLMTAYTRTDAVMIERLLPDGDVQVDHYAAAYRLLDAANMLGYLLSALLLPMYARLLAKREPVADLLGLSLPTVVAGSIVFVLPTAIYADEIVYLLYDFADARTGGILRLLIFSFVAMCVNYAYGALLSAANELGSMNRIFAVGCLLNVAGNLLVLENYGAIGAAAITTVTQSFIAVAQAIMAHRKLSLPTELIRPGRLLVFCLLFCGLCYFVSQNLTLNWLVKIGLMTSAGLLLAFLTKLLDPAQWLNLIASRQVEGD
ncbi:hypothetical protein CEQ90_06785 [Lewinellaceae bacterium SD302]|nr:hypothetical protein CEQ90_06785 [Lewinellaceae bacterium SD302]